MNSNCTENDIQLCVCGVILHEELPMVALNVLIVLIMHYLYPLAFCRIALSCWVKQISPSQKRIWQPTQRQICTSLYSKFEWILLSLLIKSLYIHNSSVWRAMDRNYNKLAALPLSTFDATQLQWLWLLNWEKIKMLKSRKKKLHLFSIHWYNGFQHKYYKIHQKALLQV